MQEKLILFLHISDPGKTCWVVLGEQAQVEHCIISGDTAGLSQLAINKEVIVVVPAEQVLLTMAKLPKLNRSRLLQALPYALEEQLVADVDTLHFAPGPYQADDNLPVAVVAKEKMQYWLSLLQDWRVQADAFIPSSLALPYTENTWQVLISAVAMVRTGLFQGFVCDIANLPTMLDLALAAGVSAPPLIYLHNYTQQAISSTYQLPVTVKEDMINPEQLLSDLARNVVTYPSLDLLQGEYAVKRARLPQMDKMKRVASYLAIGWLALLVLVPTLSYCMLSYRANRIDAQIAQIYQRNFPQATSIVAPELRMQEKWQKLSAELGQNRFLLLTAYVGKSMLNAANVALKRFDFQNNQLTLELSAPSSDDVNAFNDALSQQGVTVKQQNANLAGGRANATLVIE